MNGINEFIAYFSPFASSSILKLMINAMFWSYIAIGIYYIFRKNQIMAFWLFLSSFGLSVPYLFVKADNLPAILDTNKTRLFLEEVFFLSLLLQAINFTLLKKFFGYKASWPIHLVISFIVVVGFAVLYISFAGASTTLEFANLKKYIFLAFISSLGGSILWSGQQAVRGRYLKESEFSNLQDAIADSFFDILGSVLALLFLLYYIDFIINLIGKS